MSTCPRRPITTLTLHSKIALGRDILWGHGDMWTCGHVALSQVARGGVVVVWLRCGGCGADSDQRVHMSTCPTHSRIYGVLVRDILRVMWDMWTCGHVVFEPGGGLWCDGLCDRGVRRGGGGLRPPCPHVHMSTRTYHGTLMSY